MAIIIGTAGDDFLVGTAFDDDISGLAGDDLIDPGTGNDIVDGGTGFDTLSLSDYVFVFVFAGGTGGTATDFFGNQVYFSNIEALAGSDTEALLGTPADAFLLDGASHGYTVDAGAGFDLVRPSLFADTITLGTDQGDLVFVSSFAYSDGDVFTDFDNNDSLGFIGLTFTLPDVTLTSTATQTTLEIDGNQDGVTDATITLLGDYTDGAFELQNLDGNTYIYWNSNTGETLNGGAGTNYFRGGLGNDTYNGLAGRDFLSGDAGNDTLNGGDGHDNLDPGTGTNDVIDGGAGFDTMFLPDYGSIFLIAFGTGGTAFNNLGTDNVSFSNIERVIGNDTEAPSNSYADIFLLNNADYGYTIDAGAGLDYVALSPFADTITLGTDQGDLLRGTSFAAFDGDIFTDFDNNDSMGFLGLTFTLDDLTLTSTATETVLEIDGNQDGFPDATITLQGDYTDGAFELLNLDGSTYLYWNANAGETLSGGEGRNIFRGGLGDDTYYGLGGDDQLQGDAGNDALYGGDGNDTLNPGTGTNDVIDGGAGFDTLFLTDYGTVFLFADGDSGSAFSSQGDWVDFSNIEAIVGTDREAAGADIFGDTVLLDNAGHGYTVNVGGGLDYVRASDFADTITLGTDQGDLLRAISAGAFDGDVITDFDNNDSLGFLIGNFTLDDVTQTSTATETVLEIDEDQDGVTDATITLLGDYTDGSFELLNVDGSTFIYWNSNTGESLHGGEGQNIFRGGFGDDIYNGLGGDDFLGGKAGNDTLNGGDGNDALSPGTGANDTVDGGAGYDSLYLTDYNTAYVVATGGQTGLAWNLDSDGLVIGQTSFSNVEAITGTNTEAPSGYFADTFDLQAAGQGYTIFALAGLDYVLLSDFADTIFLGADQGDLVRGTSLAAYDGDVFTDWDNSDSMGFLGITFTLADVTQTSTATETTLEIDGNQDGVTDATITLLGDYTDGAFELLNQDGSTFIYWNSNTGESLNGGEGRNFFRGSLGDDTYNGLGGDDQLEGDAGNDTLNGGDGNDLLGGESGSDVMTGGAGTDTFYSRGPGDFDGDTITDLELDEQLYFDGANFDEGAVTLTAGAAEATLSADVDGDGSDDFTLTLEGDFSGLGFIVSHSGDSTTLTLANVLSGSNGPGSMTGTPNSDLIDTGHGPGSADGGGGNDLLRGGGGAQTLSGGDGNDQLFGGAGNDILHGDNGDDRLAGGRGNDTLTGGLGADIFVFEEHDGRDTVTDFEDGLDRIDLSAFGYSDVSELTITQDGTDAKIQLLGGVSVVLEDFNAANLDNNDFIFG